MKRFVDFSAYQNKYDLLVRVPHVVQMVWPVAVQHVYRNRLVKVEELFQVDCASAVDHNDASHLERSKYIRTDSVRLLKEFERIVSILDSEALHLHCPADARR